MGLKLFSDTCDTSQPPNPNKYDFSIIKQQGFGSYSVITIKYNGCTTFDGVKLLVVRGWVSEHCRVLDPHLLGNNHIVVARFEPNETGLALACMCAEKLSLIDLHRTIGR